MGWEWANRKVPGGVLPLPPCSAPSSFLQVTERPGPNGLSPQAEFRDHFA
jgi:hypothetical protein